MQAAGYFVLQPCNQNQCRRSKATWQSRNIGALIRRRIPSNPCKIKFTMPAYHPSELPAPCCGKLPGPVELGHGMAPATDLFRHYIRNKMLCTSTALSACDSCFQAPAGRCSILCFCSAKQHVLRGPEAVAGKPDPRTAVATLWALDCWL